MISLGLDTYAVISHMVDKNLIHARAPNDKFNNIDLCGGLFSGTGASFRGKIYADLVEEITNVSLYSEYIEPSVVSNMHDDLKTHIHKDDDPEIIELVKFFRVCKDNGYGLIGWW